MAQKYEASEVELLALRSAAAAAADETAGLAHRVQRLQSDVAGKMVRQLSMSLKQDRFHSKYY